jgi:hypothetical protein
LAVTIAAKQLEVLQPVVAPVPVHVVELHAQRLPLPLGDPAAFAAVLLQAGVQKSPLQVMAVGLPTDNQQLADVDDPGSKRDVPASDRAVPGLPRKAEALLAITPGQAIS